MSWGPSHQQTRRGRRRRRSAMWEKIGQQIGLFIGWLILAALLERVNQTASDVVGWAGSIYFLGLILWVIYLQLPARFQRLPLPARLAPRVPQAGPDLRHGVWLGLNRFGDPRLARAERAVLILGPPRAGKTSAVIIPTLLSQAGPVVSTSTKPDVMAATQAARAIRGRVWQFDPTGSTRVPDGVEALRWSPVSCSLDWDGALLMARAMVTGAQVGRGTTDGTHWTRRAQALLAPMLHAAAVSGGEIRDVVNWVTAHEIDQPGALLQEHGGTDLAISQLAGLQNTEARERSSIFSAASDALDGYTSHAALTAASQPNFHPGRFVESHDTVYIHAPAEQQHLVAPLVCGLLSEIRRATYAAHRNQTLPASVLFALDEVANIAPLTELPQIASEGASQGLLLLAALQDLSQARARWGTAADGFLTLFGEKLLLPGIADRETLETVSAALGEYDRQVVSQTRPHRSALDLFNTRLPPARDSTTVSTQRTRVLSAGDIARIPAGQALHLDGIRWELLTLTPAHATEPWRALTSPAT